MSRRNTRSNKGRKGIVDTDYLEDKYCSPTPPKRSRSSPHAPKPSAATTRNGRGSGGGDAVSNKGASHKFNVTEIARQVNGNIEKQFVQRVLDEMFMPSNKTMLKDVAGNENAKSALREMVLLPAIRPDLFVGLRTPPKGLLMYGPPGNGKTLMARALANEAPEANFFNISASSLTSKWVGEAEKTVRALFAVAAVVQPAIIFVDEVDSLLSTRKESDDALWRLKTEFLIQLDGIAANPNDRIVLIAATNMPQKLDQAVLRRFQKRIMIPLPTLENRVELLTRLLGTQANNLTSAQIKEISQMTHNYSGSDLTQLAKDAAMVPIRHLSSAEISKLNKIRAMNFTDIKVAMARVRPSTTSASIAELESWTRSYGELSTKNL